MNGRKEKNQFKASLSELIETFASNTGTAASRSFASAEMLDPLEHNTRSDFIDLLLEHLGWVRGLDQGKLSEEARLKGEKTLFIDYVGVVPDSRAPLLIVEAKAWFKPLVAASSEALVNQGPQTTNSKEGLLASALDHLKGVSDTPALITKEWLDWIRQLSDYVCGVHAKSGHIVKRAVLTAGRWLVIFEDPRNAFIDLTPTRPLGILIIELEDYVERSDDIYERLAFSTLTVDVPLLRPAQIRAYASAAKTRGVFRALWVRRDTTGAYFALAPRLEFHAAVVLERGDGIFVKVIGNGPSHVLPLDRSGLATHLSDIAEASDRLLADLRSELGLLLDPMAVESFPGFEDPNAMSASDYGSISTTKVLLWSYRKRADEFLLVTGQDSHFLRMTPAIDPCTGHDWAACRQVGQAREEAPIVSPSVKPKSFFFSGQLHHCANSVVHGRRGPRCHIDPFEDFLCCRACNFENICWEASEVEKLPCGRDYPTSEKAMQTEAAVPQGS